ncbi:EAL domain-containing protein [Pseudoalteromonas sp. SR43-6]|uniref:bifunctional diguanylate cyclase/phosphodiesterase n=1 Tax=unclassified Pseudoalteromonas TaxID=194690 RepID=UPI0015FC28AE|nr:MULTISPECIES: LapD/MoxY N-terminal periplasmic domain-containing protein [unclassified Pseudoalteromonas]MBB1290937.1 EAL domain-containing protein [Pseudoalteromonas sp. SR41-5]MBB1376359.1 EAL domain-containing protein [Pseudoalteromonas sp. SR43-6]MBB1415512.1 EAL domain-containing protein [Pseudoalteromonas sp. SG43-8]
MASFSLSKYLKKRKITLRQELWIALLIVIFVGFISSVLISTNSAKSYFSTQLYLKNVDNASSLALMISQLDKDPVELELLVSATFDTGHYKRIELQNPNGEVIVKRTFTDELKATAPQWFRAMYGLNVQPGVGQVNNGWQQFGTLFIESHSQYAEQALWESALKLFFSFLIVAFFACIVSAYFLSRILKPLDDVVYQANAFGEKRFIKSSVPRTFEFARLVQSMNQLSTRFSRIIKEDNKRLEELRFKSQHDELTGLANREYFGATLEAHLQKSKDHAHGALFLFRVVNLDRVSEEVGRVEMVNFLRRFSQMLVSFLESNQEHFSENYIARISHSDFTVLFSDIDDIQAISERILLMHQSFVEEYKNVKLAIPHSCTYIQKDDTRFDVLKRADELLKSSGKQSDVQAKVAQIKQESELFDNATSWKNAIEEALNNNNLEINTYPVTSFTGPVMQNQLGLSLKLGGQVYRASYYYQWANRLKLLARLDWGLIKALVAHYSIEPPSELISVELSAQTLLDDAALASILTYLSAFPDLASKICFDIRESIAVSEIKIFKDFCEQARCMGAKVALKRVGPEFTKIYKIQEFGLEMIKIDSVYGHNISYSQDNQTFLRGVCTLAHSIGIKVVAQGVTSQDDIDTLINLGFDGVIKE